MTGVMNYEARQEWIRKKIQFLNRNHVSLDPANDMTVISDIHPSELNYLPNWEINIVDVGDPNLWSLELSEKSTGREFEFWVRIITQ